jgi:hypothetical protein
MVLELYEPDLDQFDQVRVDLVEVIQHHVMQLGCNFHASRPAPHYHKGQQLLALLFIGTQNSVTMNLIFKLAPLSFARLFNDSILKNNAVLL